MSGSRKQGILVAVRTRPTSQFAQDEIHIDPENAARACCDQSPSPPALVGVGAAAAAVGRE